MNIFLIIANCIFFIVIIILLVNSMKKERLVSSHDMENMDLMEFQHNLKELIEELNKTAENSVKALEVKRSETDEYIKIAAARADELRYLIERSQLRREAQYKEALSDTVDTEPVLPFENVKAPPAPSVPTSKFTLNEPEEGTETLQGSQPKDKYQYVSTLIKNGMSIEEISKVTGLTRGEIDLIKNIKKQ